MLQGMSVESEGALTDYVLIPRCVGCYSLLRGKILEHVWYAVHVMCKARNAQMPLHMRVLAFARMFEVHAGCCCIQSE